MSPAEHRAVDRTYAMANSMGALLPQPLSAPAVRVHAETSLVLERFPRELSGMRSSQAVIVEPDAEEPMPLVEHVIVWLGIVVTTGLLVYVTVERML